MITGDDQERKIEILPELAGLLLYTSIGKLAKQENEYQWWKSARGKQKNEYQ